MHSIRDRMLRRIENPIDIPQLLNEPLQVDETILASLHCNTIHFKVVTPQIVNMSFLVSFLRPCHAHFVEPYIVIKQIVVKDVSNLI